MYDYDRTKVWNSSRGKAQRWRNGREKSSPSRKQEVVPDGESYQGRRGLEKAHGCVGCDVIAGLSRSQVAEAEARPWARSTYETSYHLLSSTIKKSSLFL